MNLTIVLNKSLVCPLCDRPWPPEDRYEECPCCRESTKGNTVRPCIDSDKATHLADDFDFGWWLYEHPNDWAGW